MRVRITFTPHGRPLIIRSRISLLQMAVMQAESRIGALWQQRMDSLKEYDVVRDGNVFGAGLAGGCLFSSEYDKARALLGELIVPV